MEPNLSPDDIETLIAYARGKFEDERYPFAPALRPVREVLEKLDPRPRPEPRVAWFIAQPIGRKLSPYVFSAEQRSTPLFYAAFFALSFQFATMFDDVRLTASEIHKLF